MQPMLISSIMFVVTAMQSPAGGADVPASGPLDVAELRSKCATLFEHLDSMRVASDYRKAAKDLLSVDPGTQIKGFRVLSMTGDPEVIPWIVPHLNSPVPEVRVWAGSALSNVVSSWALERRDPAVSDRVVLKPLPPGQTDLRPLAWVVLQMLQMPDDGSTHAYAATMIRYLELREFESYLRKLLRSRHPAVSNKAAWALKSLGFGVDRPHDGGT